uniref:Galectin n=1 Tax=Capra hircus TaxID=9925 RepID=A0A8C2XZC3_CAPHI
MQSGSGHVGIEERDFRHTQDPYINPPVPFTGRIEGGLQDGHKVTVLGHVPSKGEKRFSVNFQTGISDTNNIAFHFNPRFDGGGYVVCNTRQLGNWGSEAKKMQMPFQKGSEFEICFDVDRSSFKVTVNGSIFLDYVHRVPFDKVNAISICGCVHVSYISFQVRLHPALVPRGFVWGPVPLGVLLCEPKVPASPISRCFWVHTSGCPSLS